MYNKMTTNVLQIAAREIANMYSLNVTAIQFEDGSGHKFNYQLDGHQEWKFIDLHSVFIDNIKLRNDRLREGIQQRDYDAVMKSFKAKLRALNDGLGSHFQQLIDLAEEKGKNGVIDDIFNNDQN